MLADQSMIIKRNSVTLSPANILALHTTEIEVVPAQGSGKAILLNRVILGLDYNSTAYAGIAAADNFQIRITDITGEIIALPETIELLDQTADTIIGYRSGSYVFSQKMTLVDNAPLVISLAGAVTSGNSPVKVTCFYEVIDLATFLS